MRRPPPGPVGSPQDREAAERAAEFGRLLEFAKNEIGHAVASLEADPVMREKFAVFVFNGWDRLSASIYDEVCNEPGSSLPKGLEPGDIKVVGCPYAEMLVVLSRRYDLSELTYAPLGPGQVRVFLFAQGRVSAKLVDRIAVPLPAGVMRGPGGDA